MRVHSRYVPMATDLLIAPGYVSFFRSPSKIAVFRTRSKQTSQMRQSTDPTEDASAEERKSAPAT
jgi:hypothetical protein